MGGACQVVVTNPLECVKVRLQTTNAGNCFEVVRALGFEGLSTGALACALRDASFSAILFPTYAHAKVFLPEMLHLQGPASLFLAGLLSAAPAAFLTTPLDVVKTRQLEPPSPTAACLVLETSRRASTLRALTSS